MSGSSRTKAGNYAPTCVLLTNVGLSKVSHINCEGDRHGYRARSIGISFVGGTNIPTETYFDHVHVFFKDKWLRDQKRELSFSKARLRLGVEGVAVELSEWY